MGRLRRHGLTPPSLELSTAGRWACVVSFFAALGAVFIQLGGGWPVAFAAPKIGQVIYWISRPWAIHVPPIIRTVGDLAIYGLRFGEHAESGYQWSHGDISLKFRVAEATGMPLDSVRPETRFDEILC